LTPQPITSASFIDRGPGLVNDRPLSFAVAPVYRAGVSLHTASTGAEVRQGPRVTLQAVPVALPPGFMGSSIHEGERSGSVRFEPATGEFRLFGFGAYVWSVPDSLYFVNRTVTGDFQALVQVPALPTAPAPDAKAGLMVRSSLDGGAAYAFLAIMPRYGFVYQWRSAPNSYSEHKELHREFKLPITLRLTRHGHRITADYMLAGDRSFRSATEPTSFQPPLPQTLHIGLAVCGAKGRVVEARFRGLEIQKG
jgi:hypothetical protein